jgi:ornithine cyclodeaminase/alanine dehydrogenase-like protein (mu-crystallin family)
MPVLIANQEQVTELLSMKECIPAMEDALRMLTRGDAVLPLRTRMLLPDGRNIMGLMPSCLGGLHAAAVKVITIFPANLGTEYDSHQGVVLLFDTQRGLLRAIVDGTAVTAIRTAAVSAVATRALARLDAHDLAIIGAGTQGRTHLEAMLAVRDIRRVRLFSLIEEEARRFAARESQRHGIDVEVEDSAEAAVRGADIICTVTTSTEPVVLGRWVAPGSHINAVGAFSPDSRELDTELVAKARLYADRREAMLAESGDFLIPRAEGVIGDEHILGEIGEVLEGEAPGRTAPEQITIFKSLGIAVEDLAAAHLVLSKARQTGKGTWIEMGGRHFGSV